MYQSYVISSKTTDPEEDDAFVLAWVCECGNVEEIEESYD